MFQITRKRKRGLKFSRRKYTTYKKKKYATGHDTPDTYNSETETESVGSNTDATIEYGPDADEESDNAQPENDNSSKTDIFDSI